MKNIVLDDSSNNKEGPDGVKLFVWDTAGQERFKHIVKSYYKNIHGAILAFDLTQQESFDNINFWLNDINKHAPEEI